MGWWNTGRDGTSLHVEDTGLLWGDSPADFMDDALEKIVYDFIMEHERNPTCGELRAGLEFSLMGLKDDATYYPG